ncbi:DUF218 domain [Carpediemonas membranifera]|uniref:DUF218 domain n=1 Tax=Carpediemonas membranifera TaxID=201153 RepID=A0A8J6B0B6_9EUKA|nr:DUF218 domain [Carpediemonas membranifera]|eukprot:KAG9390194.1 DUF218 domain [Carpediemonas membranifera]
MSSRRASVSSTISTTTGIGISYFDSPGELPLLSRIPAPGAYGAFGSETVSEKGDKKRVFHSESLLSMATPTIIQNTKKAMVSKRHRRRPKLIQILGCCSSMVLSAIVAVAVTILLYVLAAVLWPRDALGTMEWSVFAVHNDDGKDFDAVVVPGFELAADGGIQGELESRLEAALALYRQGRIRGQVILTGGNPAASDKTTEAEAMGSWLSSRGVPQATLVLENQSKDAVGKARFTTPILVDASYKRVALVTSTVNQYRFFWLFHGQCQSAAFCQASFRVISISSYETGISVARKQLDFFREVVSLLVAVIQGSVVLW